MGQREDCDGFGVQCNEKAPPAPPAEIAVSTRGLATAGGSASARSGAANRSVCAFAGGAPIVARITVFSGLVPAFGGGDGATSRDDPRTGRYRPASLNPRAIPTM